MRQDFWLIIFGIIAIVAYSQNPQNGAITGSLVAAVVDLSSELFSIIIIVCLLVCGALLLHIFLNRFHIWR